MNSQALYRKYRSRTLDEVLGQEHVTSVLKRALEKGKIAHAYLLTGPRGVGKTSVARILAHEINHLPYDEDSTHLDIIEIDAASNNGVDDIRNLREKAQIAPTSAPKKIYIIDEVHMLSKQAFNALLKTLEEPPVHVVFILATTDADKLPSTILSRVQQFYFHPISVDIMAGQLQNIAKKEGFKIEPKAAELIAERSHGGFRDAISLLDQLSVLASDKKPLTAQQVSSHLGLTDEKALEELVSARENSDVAKTLTILRQLHNQGTDPQVVTAQLLRLLRENLAQKPELVELISELIEVTKHPHPDLKLLTIFAKSPNHKYPTPAPKQTPKAVAQKASVTASVVNEPNAKYSRTPSAQSPISQAGSSLTDTADALDSPLTESQSLRDGELSSDTASRDTKSSETSATRVSDDVNPTETRSEAVSDDFGSEDGRIGDIAKKSVLREDDVVGLAGDNKAVSDDLGSEIGNSEDKKQTSEIKNLDWQQVLDQAKTTSSGLYTLLNKCSYKIEGNKLTLYAGTKFAAKKLDDSKFRPIISEIIQKSAKTDVDIIIVGDKKPPEDKQLAEIAAMMGGGEEVKLDELETAK